MAAGLSVRTSGPADLAIFGLLVLTWGSSFLLMKVSLEGLTPPQIALTRLMLGSLTLVVFLRATRRRLPRSAKLWAHMAVVGVTQCSIPFTLVAFVVEQIPSGLTSIYNAIVPTMTLILTPLLLRGERLTRVQILGVAIGIVGVVVLMAPWRYVDSAAFADNLPAQLGMLASTTSYAFGIVYMRRFISGTSHDAVTISTMQILLATAPLLLLAPITAMSPVTITPTVVVAMTLLGAFGTGFAYVWQTRIIQRWGATRTSTVTYLMPVVGVGLGILLLGETIEWNEPVGGAIILVGVLAAQLARAPVRPVGGAGA